MSEFEPTVLGITVLMVSLAEMNQVLQACVFLATLVYTIIKVYQLLKK
jgi:hypothetical protein